MPSHFQLAKFSFNLKAEEPMHLPSYKGSTFRGAFGYAFKKIVCALRKEECNDCLLKGKCIYSYVFETPVPTDSGKMRKYPQSPHPFIIEPPLENKRYYRQGETILFNLILIGKAIDYLPYFIYTFVELGKRGIKKDEGRYILEEVKDHQGKGIYHSSDMILHDSFARICFEDMYPPKDAPGNNARYPQNDTQSPQNNAQTPQNNTLTRRNNKLTHQSNDIHQSNDDRNSSIKDTQNHNHLTITFLTPTRIKYNERFTLDIEFHVFIRNLLRRLSLLSYFHCGEELDLDFKEIIEKAWAVTTLSKSLHWHDWERYSNRQKTSMKLGGFVGEITYEGDITPFWPYVKLGEYVHVGKGSSFGLGKYEVENE